MGDFDSLLRSKTSKRKCIIFSEGIYKRERSANKDISLKELQTLNIVDIKNRDIKNKLNTTLIDLWGIIDMKSFVDALSGDTVNPYFLTSKELLPIKNLDCYTFLSDRARFLNLLDIKYIKSFSLEGITFTNVYLTTFEIADGNNIFRPYVTLLTLNSNNEFVEFGYGYDTNNNGNVELFISSFNYIVFLTSKGILTSPLSGKSIKLKVYDILTSKEIGKLYESTEK